MFSANVTEPSFIPIRTSQCGRVGCVFLPHIQHITYVSDPCHASGGESLGGQVTSHEGFMADKMPLGQYLCFTLPVSFHQCSKLIHSSTTDTTPSQQ